VKVTKPERIDNPRACGLLLYSQSSDGRKKYGKKMEGKKIAGWMRLSVDHSFATRFFCQFYFLSRGLKSTLRTSSSSQMGGYEVVGLKAKIFSGRATRR
jgi:hypothetical protein